MLGTDIFPVEVSGITKHGLWILLDDEEEELFVSFAEFPWFRKAPVAELFNVVRPRPHHLYWRELDIDLHVDPIRHPETFPLVSQPTA